LCTAWTGSGLPDFQSGVSALIHHSKACSPKTFDAQVDQHSTWFLHFYVRNPSPVVRFISNGRLMIVNNIVNPLKSIKMKKAILIIALFTGLAFTVNAQSATTKAKKEKKTMEMKDHSCTSACADGKHVYAHGEKGHACTDACTTKDKAAAHGEKGHVCTEACKTARSGTAMKDHTCTTACAEGKHVYAHGEKGHTCTEACKKKK
jgi:hypothetical protein